MRAIAIFPGSKQVRLVDTPEPVLSSPTDVRVRILDVGVCGTDREICSFEYGTPPSGSDHLVIGHEALGEVVEVGPAVRRVQPGDLVVPMVRRPCGRPECVACRLDRQDFCTTGHFFERGIKERGGFMTDQIVDDERWMFPVPSSLRDVAVLVEPLTIATKALIQVWDVQERVPWGPDAMLRATDRSRARGSFAVPEDAGKGLRAVVLGAGPVGLLGATTLAAAGFDTHVVSREAPGGPKAKLVASIGASYVSSEQVPLASLSEQIGPIDVAYEATGASRAAFELLKELGPNGIFVFTGVPGRKTPIEFDTDHIMRNMVLKNQVVIGTVNAGADAYHGAIRDLGIFSHRWGGALRSLITGRYAPESYLDLLHGQMAGHIKDVLAFG